MQSPASALQRPASSSWECRLMCSTRRGGRGAIVLNLRLCFACLCMLVRACAATANRPLCSDTSGTQLLTPCALLFRRFSGCLSHASTMAASRPPASACTLAVALPIAADKYIHANFRPGVVALCPGQAPSFLWVTLLDQTCKADGVCLQVCRYRCNVFAVRAHNLACT